MGQGWRLGTTPLGHQLISLLERGEDTPEENRHFALPHRLSILLPSHSGRVCFTVCYIKKNSRLCYRNICVVFFLQLITVTACNGYKGARAVELIECETAELGPSCVSEPGEWDSFSVFESLLKNPVDMEVEYDLMKI